VVANEWEEEETTSTDVEEIERSLSPGATRPCLTVLTGGAAGHLFKMRSTSVIGRIPNAEVRLEDDGISRQHARVRVEADRAWIEDLGSRNGTFVNGARISDLVELHDGDKVQVGRSTVLRFGMQDALDESFHEQLVSSALRDSLTKLYNKRYLLERLDSELKFALRHESALSILMVDLDHFKNINDEHGHLGGDAVLAQLSNVLARAVRNEDVVARFGGEEMVVILRATGMDPALHTAERLCRLVENTVTVFHDQPLRATCSIGVAGLPSSSAKSCEELIEHADRALYRAKGAGRNRASR
jgi:diguanylate cyclase (GGDEF)-like protein